MFTFDTGNILSSEIYLLIVNVVADLSFFLKVFQW